MKKIGAPAGGQVEMFRGMMRNMRRPEKPGFMTQPVIIPMDKMQLSNPVDHNHHYIAGLKTETL
jgi:hypothetical protein